MFWATSILPLHSPEKVWGVTRRSNDAARALRDDARMHRETTSLIYLNYNI